MELWTSESSSLQQVYTITALLDGLSVLRHVPDDEYEKYYEGGDSPIFVDLSGSYWLRLDVVNDESEGINCLKKIGAAHKLDISEFTPIASFLTASEISSFISKIFNKKRRESIVNEALRRC